MVDLTPTQEDALFGIYAGASPAFDPSMFVAAPSLGPNAVIYPADNQRPIATPSPNAPVRNQAPSPTTPAPAPISQRPSENTATATASVDNDSPVPDPQVEQQKRDATDQQVLAVLDPEQQAAVLESWDEQDALWDFIVDDINQEVDDAIDLALELLDEQLEETPTTEEPVNDVPIQGGYIGQDIELFRP